MRAALFGASAVSTGQLDRECAGCLLGLAMLGWEICEESGEMEMLDDVDVRRIAPPQSENRGKRRDRREPWKQCHSLLESRSLTSMVVGVSWTSTGRGSRARTNVT